MTTFVYNNNNNDEEEEGDAQTGEVSNGLYIICIYRRVVKVEAALNVA